MRGSTADDIELPLDAFNPMGKEHVAEQLEEYISMGADAIAAEAVEDAVAKLEHADSHYNVGLVLADDAKGGWTNRYATEFAHRYDVQAHFRRGWTTGLLWTNEPSSLEHVRREAASAVFRAAYVQRNGIARTLRQMLSQTRYISANAGYDTPTYEVEEMEYSRQVIEPFLDSEIMAVQIACLFGDDVASELGHQPLGLSFRAGMALAACDG